MVPLLKVAPERLEHLLKVTQLTSGMSTCWHVDPGAQMPETLPGP